jgi:hypothetical protein
MPTVAFQSPAQPLSRKRERVFRPQPAPAASFCAMAEGEITGV